MSRRKKLLAVGDEIKGDNKKSRILTVCRVTKEHAFARTNSGGEKKFLRGFSGSGRCFPLHGKDTFIRYSLVGAKGFDWEGFRMSDLIDDMEKFLYKTHDIKLTKWRRYTGIDPLADGEFEIPPIASEVSEKGMIDEFDSDKETLLHVILTKVYQAGYVCGRRENRKIMELLQDSIKTLVKREKKQRTK